MKGKTGTKILLTVLFIIAASFSIQTVALAPATIIPTIKTETLAHQTQHSPASELEGTHVHLSTPAQTLAKKNLMPCCYLPASDFNNSNTSLQNVRIRELSCLIKDYLFHIYPTHNFW